MMAPFHITIVLLFNAMTASVSPQESFLEQQLRYERVREAMKEKKHTVYKHLNASKLAIENFELLLVAYKEEGQLEVYAKAKNGTSFNNLTTYPICAKSGVLGPKRMEGDKQVPEGFYHINRFNPSSQFHLSLGLNYPNASDKVLSDKQKPGSEIFVHGHCVTVGCLPMTDDKIKEIYLMAVYAKENGQQKIPVYIFPFRMNDENMKTHLTNPDNRMHSEFWGNLKQGYDAFNKSKQALRFTTNPKGKYQLKP